MTDAICPQDDDITPRADCYSCRYAVDVLARGDCHPGDICVRAESGRQIDRFFRRNAYLAARYLGDSFWERRAIATRYVPLELLPPLIHDADEVVRRAVAVRIDKQHLSALRLDPDREVRITVARRLAPENIEQMAKDTDYLVRVYVAQRLPTGRLFRMITDPEVEVRKVVAARLPSESLGLMAHDDAHEVRVIVAQRVDEQGANQLLNDSHWLVRYYAVQSATPALVARLQHDPDEEVRQAVDLRLT